jgi:hypothetical protein
VKPPTDYLVAAGHFPSPEDVAGAVADRVLRADVGRPGFALLDLGPDGTPPAFRSWLLRLASALSGESGRRFGRSLRPLSLDRFDQQATTLPHRDGGPDDSVLLLGYEPTEVLSRLVLLDYTHAALDRGLTPTELLARFNPMASRGEDVLGAYAAEAVPFEPGRYRVAVVNNGTRPPGPDGAGKFGVLHQATIVRPLPGKPRPVNSLLLAGAAMDAPPLLPPEALEAFVAHGTPAAGSGED